MKPIAYLIQSGIRHYRFSLIVMICLVAGLYLTAVKSQIVEPIVHKAKQFDIVDSQNWYRNLLDKSSSPVDLSFLNAAERPAGKRGFLQAKGEQLVFEDGTQAKFWGVNIAAYTIFQTPKQQVTQQVKRLSALGVNLVRLHHMDSPWVVPNVFGGDNQQDTKTLNLEALDKIDWWIKCLKDEGIYVWLDLHVQRAFKPADAITHFSEISQANGLADLKGFNYVNPTIERAMREFNAAYLEHLNPYTHKKLIDEPAIAAVLITNENDVTHHFGNSLLPDKGVKSHSELYMHAAEKFALNHQLSIDSTWRSWQHGSSKLFLNDLEHQFNIRMIKHLKDIGLKVPIATTNTWGNNPLSSLPALTDGDIIDAHAYQDSSSLATNPIVTPDLTHWLAAAQVVAKPVSVTEWNADPFPAPDRHTLPIYVASKASFQGWDAMMLYAYAQEPIEASNAAGSASNWNSYNDPAMMATMPAAALIFRRGDVKEANKTYVLDLGKNLFNQEVTPKNSIFLRTASELGKLQIAMPATIQLPWLKKSLMPKSATVINDPNHSMLAIDTENINNNELKRDLQKETMLINATQTQAIAGWVGGETITLNDVTFSLNTKNAVVVVQSLDAVAIRKSKNILISMAARSIPSKDGQLPYLSEPVNGTLMIQAPEGLKLYKKGRFQKTDALPVSYKDGHYEIMLNRTLNTYWLNLK